MDRKTIESLGLVEGVVKIGLVDGRTFTNAEDGTIGFREELLVLSDKGGVLYVDPGQIAWIWQPPWLPPPGEGDRDPRGPLAEGGAAGPDGSA